MKLFKRIIMTIFLFAFFGCGTQELSVLLPDPQSCTVYGTTIACPDGTVIEIPAGIPGTQGEQGIAGIDGTDGDNSVVLTVIPAPNKNECVELGQTSSGAQLYGENEGGKGDFFNNNACADGPDPHCAYCDNINEQKHCWVENILLFIVGTDSDMQFYQLEF